jgi:hypothetical protein
VPNSFELLFEKYKQLYEGCEAYTKNNMFWKDWRALLDEAKENIINMEKNND